MQHIILYELYFMTIVFCAGIHTGASPVQDKSNQARREFRRQEQRGSSWEV